MESQFQKDKIIHFVAYFLKAFPGLGITQLYKIMSFADFEHYKLTGKSISGLEYTAYPYGPFPADLDRQLRESSSYLGSKIRVIDTGSKKKTIRTTDPVNEKFFSKRELEVMTKTLFIFKDASTDLMVKASHEYDTPWQKTIDQKKAYSKISPETILDKKGKCISLEELQRFVLEESYFKKMIHG